MSTKKERLDAICGIIQTKVISNQEELLKELEDSGFSVTQATLSRDIKQPRYTTDPEIMYIAFPKRV